MTSVAWGSFENVRPLTRNTSDEDRDDDNATHAEPIATAALPR
jgi:hypothetical protein